MLEKDLEEIAELEAANEELEAYRAQLGAVPAASPSDAALALLAERDEAHPETGDPFRSHDAAVAARKAALLAVNTGLHVEVDARESGAYPVIPSPARPVTPSLHWAKRSSTIALALGLILFLLLPALLHGCFGL